MNQHCITCLNDLIDDMSTSMELSKTSKAKFKGAIECQLKTLPSNRKSVYDFGIVHRIARTQYNYAQMDNKKRNSIHKTLLDSYDTYKDLITSSEEPLKTALSFAVSANILDYAVDPKANVESIKNFVHSKSSNLALNNGYSQFVKNLDKAKDIVYIGDNVGEIFFDRLLIETIQALYPHIIITYITRANKTSSDVILSDTEVIGLNKIVTCVSSGSDLPGTILSEVTLSVNQHITNCDLVISKGQGNYGSLHDENINATFLFLSKCNKLMEELNQEKNTITIKNIYKDK